MSQESSEPQTLIRSEFQKKIGSKIKCEICPHLCTLQEKEIGNCGGREVISGELIATNYGQISSLQLDPIEKKPLYNFFPGSEILSVGPNGCSLSCAWCLNWKISQAKQLPTRMILPDDLVGMVEALDGIGVAYTYGEPLIWFEFVQDVGKILHERGLVNILLSNGYINEAPLKKLLPITDAFNIDLKSVDDCCYTNFCGGKLEDVQRTIKIVHDAGKHLELTHLLVSDVSTDLRKTEELINWIANIDPSIPLHLSKYFPANRFDKPATDMQFISDAFELAKSKLDWVYISNIWNGTGDNSVCKCGNLLVERTGYDIDIKGMDGNICKACGAELNFVVDMK
ncbi:MAG: AmmeMemoRadiSam system radical SAM enzyme [Calditrichaeota bacterium]|mgnify:FL=1|nr:AmmeMemoRadiSam system radical SAM enzyme [Calditrichota bacterium]MBT7789208.1 AmmeMemoRadiSam system radical SAM enzyme [Calditrichota bacterium]